jgi:S-methyl-5-thioribose-1-phosphate isomerase
MKIDGIPYRSVWVDRDDGWSVRILDQTKLPWSLEILRLTDEDEVAHAIRSMQVRGAPLIGAVAAYGVALALRRDASTANLDRVVAMLGETRPTAINLRWALERMRAALHNLAPSDRVAAAYAEAGAICDDDVETCRRIGEHGLPLLQEIAARKGRVNVLTHCNAGWIATVDYGTALSPIYQAHDLGLDVHVWVDETRPRNQGAALTAWELGKHGVKHTVIADNAGGHLMQHGEVDIVIVGTDRVTRRQQDRHLPQGAGRAGQWRALLGGAAALDARHAGARRRGGDPDRGTQRRRGHGADRPHRRRADRDGAGGGRGQRRGEPGLRRDARAPRHRADHRTRADGGLRGRPGGALPRQGLSRRGRADPARPARAARARRPATSRRARQGPPRRRAARGRAASHPPSPARR